MHCLRAQKGKGSEGLTGECWVGEAAAAAADDGAAAVAEAAADGVALNRRSY